MTLDHGNGASAEDSALVAGNLALDFLNTRPFRDGRRVELLPGPAELVEWLVAVVWPADGAVLLGRSPPEARLLLAEARALREAVDGIVTELTGIGPTSDLHTHALNRVLGAAAWGRCLVKGPGGPKLEDRPSAAEPLGFLAPIALAAASLLTDADPERLRRCASGACGLWFLDTSRNGKRRWCSMERCGNRAKAARHYRKARGAHAASSGAP